MRGAGQGAVRWWYTARLRLFGGDSFSGSRTAHASFRSGIDGSSIRPHPSRPWRMEATGKSNLHSDLQRPAYGPHPGRGRHSACPRLPPHRGAPILVDYDRRRRCLRRDEPPRRDGRVQVIQCRETGVDLICRTPQRVSRDAVGTGPAGVPGGRPRAARRRGALRAGEVLDFIGAVPFHGARDRGRGKASCPSGDGVLVIGRPRPSVCPSPLSRCPTPALFSARTAFGR